jgi:predicted nucleic acid-binding protein
MRVVDASVVVAGLVSSDATGEWAESVLAGGPLAAPHLMPVEAASILHRAERTGEISADAASLAHADLGRLRVEYFPYEPFAERIWELRSPGSAAQLDSPLQARLFFSPGPAISGIGDPAQPLDFSLRQQVEMLTRVRRGVADHEASRKQVESQTAALAESSGELEQRAKAALQEGKEDLARESLAQRKAIEEELDELRDHYQSLQQEIDRLTAASQRLQAKIDARRAQKEAGKRGGQPGLTSYQAWYVALAEFLGAKLATLDARLALVPGPRCGFCLPPPG